MMDAVACNDQRAPGVGESTSAETLFAETQPLGRWNHTVHTVHSHGYSILGYHVHHSEVMNLGTSIQGNDMDAPHGSGTSSGETSNAISEQCIMTRGRSTNKDAHYIIGTTTESGARASDAGAQTFTGTQETGAMTQRQAALHSRNTARDARTDDRSRSREAALRHHTASGGDTSQGQADICDDSTGSTRALADSGDKDGNSSLLQDDGTRGSDLARCLQRIDGEGYGQAGISTGYIPGEETASSTPVDVIHCVSAPGQEGVDAGGGTACGAASPVIDEATRGTGAPGPGHDGIVSTANDTDVTKGHSIDDGAILDPGGTEARLSAQASATEEFIEHTPSDSTALGKYTVSPLGHTLSNSTTFGQYAGEGATGVTPALADPGSPPLASAAGIKEGSQESFTATIATEPLTGRSVTAGEARGRSDIASSGLRQAGGAHERALNVDEWLAPAAGDLRRASAMRPALAADDLRRVLASTSLFSEVTEHISWRVGERTRLGLYSARMTIKVIVAALAEDALRLPGR